MFFIIYFFKCLKLDSFQNARVDIKKFDYKYNQKFVKMKPIVTNMENGSVIFKNDVEYLEDIIKMVVS